MASLKVAGVEVLCLMYSSKEGTVYDIGTDKGTSFASKRADFVTSFVSFVSGDSLLLTMNEFLTVC
jgi:hypothetical protein